LPRAWPDWLSAKSFLKKKIKFFCREPGQQDSRQIFFFKKRKTFVESMARRALGKKFFQKKRKTLCREPARWALGKEGNGKGPLTAPFRCREPDKQLSAKKALPIEFLPMPLCRELRSAKALPRV
jgi:hypothetical protein